MRLFVAHSSDFDFSEKLYKPLRNSELNKKHGIILPHEEGTEVVTREVIRGCNALIVEVSKPSIGAGIEMGWADAFGVPVIAIYEKGSRVSSSVDHIARMKIEYSNPEDMIRLLSDALTTVDSSERPPGPAMIVGDDPFKHF